MGLLLVGKAVGRAPLPIRRTAQIEAELHSGFFNNILNPNPLPDSGCTASTSRGRDPVAAVQQTSLVALQLAMAPIKIEDRKA